MTKAATKTKTTKTTAKNSDPKHAIFNKAAREKSQKATETKRALAASEKAAKKAKVDNSLITATIEVSSKLTKTALIEVAICSAAQHIASATIDQIEQFIAAEFNIEKYHYKRESCNAARIRAHVQKALDNRVQYDPETETLHFDEKLLTRVKDEKFAALLSKTVARFKEYKDKVL